ncbi:MAG: metallophosphoesterase family protein, partial [Actinomycetota bacterium]
CGFLAGVASGPNCAGGTAVTNRLWPIAGNHEYSDAGISNYLGYFSLPGNERWYDVRIGPVHFFMLDSDEALRTASDMAAQKAWLQPAMAASNAPFKVVAVHHPPYTSSGRGPYAGMRWPFREWGADLVLNGHDHYYERLEAGGLPYVVNGIGGQSVTAFPATAVTESRAHYSGSNGAMRITATDTLLTAEFLSVDGVVRDVLTLGTDGNGSGEAAGQGAVAGATQADAASVTARVAARTVLRQGTRRVSVPVTVSLGGRAPQGATVRAAVTIRRSARGATLGRGVATVRLAADGSLPARTVAPCGARPPSDTVTGTLTRRAPWRSTVRAATRAVTEAASAARAMRAGQRVWATTGVRVTPVGGTAATARSAAAAVVR